MNTHTSIPLPQHSATLLAAAFALALLSACAVGPDYTRPAEPVSSHYDPAAEQQLAADQQDSGAQHLAPEQQPGAAWWSAFGSPALDQLMQQSIGGNLDLEAADHAIAQAGEGITAARGGLYPQVDYGAQFSRQRAAAAGANASPIANLYSVGPLVSFDLDVFGGTRRQVERQQALAELQKHRYEAAYLTLTGDVASQAILLASARAQIAAVESLLADDRRNLELVRLAHLQGSVAQTDVALAQTQLAQDQTLLPPLANQRDAARHALSILAGKAPADFTPPEFDLADFTLPANLPLSLPSDLAHQRPDILQAEAELHAASAAIGVATADLYPHLVLSGSLAQAATGPGSLLQAGSMLWSVAAGLSGPIFHGDSLQADRRAAVDGYQAALAAYRQTLLQSLGQVADVLQAIDHDGEQTAAQQQALDAAATSLRLSREGYRQGEVSTLQVLEAQRAYQQALLGQIRARTSQYLDTTQLSIALGGNSAGAFERTVAYRGGQ